MPIHPAVASRFHLLEGLSSFQELFEDPALAARKATEEYPDYAVPAVATRMHEVPGPHGSIPVRIYTPALADGAPCLVWMHGGAFIGGDLDMPEADWVARELATRAGIVVASVDYRLCTGGVTYPVPHDDVVAAVRWFRQSAPSLGADADWICLGGASAGANLAAGAALKLRDADGWKPAQLILAYPGAHAVMPTPSASLAALMTEVPDILRFPPALTRGFSENYLGGPVSRADGYAFPALAALEGLCPVLVLTAEYDDLRASGEAFSASLALAGVDVRQVQVKAMLHGFLNLPATIEPVSAALNLIACTVRPAWEPVHGQSHQKSDPAGQPGS
jgi:acetyl esterase